MANKKSNTAAAKTAAVPILKPVDITYKGVDFGTIDARRFRDQRFRVATARMLRASKKGDAQTGMDEELRMYELIFGAENVDDVFDKLAEANGGFADVSDVREFMQYVIEQAQAKN